MTVQNTDTQVMGITINGDKYLTLQETAEFLGIEYSVVANLVHYHRELVSIKVGGGRFVTLDSAMTYKSKQADPQAVQA